MEAEGDYLILGTNETGPKLTVSTQEVNPKKKISGKKSERYFETESASLRPPDEADNLKTAIEKEKKSPPLEGEGEGEENYMTLGDLGEEGYMYLGSGHSDKDGPKHLKSQDLSVDDTTGFEFEEVQPPDVGEFVYVPKNKNIPQDKDAFLVKDQIIRTNDSSIYVGQSSERDQDQDETEKSGGSESFSNVSTIELEKEKSEGIGVDVDAKQKLKGMKELREATGGEETAAPAGTTFTLKQVIIGASLFFAGMVIAGGVVGVILGIELNRCRKGNP